MPSGRADAAPLRALAEGARVVLDVGEETIDCRVIAVGGDDATVAPVVAADTAYIPTLGRPAALVFAAGGRRTRVPGVVRPGPGAEALSFSPGGGSGLPPRRRAARVRDDLPVALTLLGAGDEPAEPPRRVRTIDLSVVGFGVRFAGPALPVRARLRFALELPDPPPIEGTVEVLRVADGLAGLEVVQIAPADRARLAAFLLGRRRAASSR